MLSIDHKKCLSYRLIIIFVTISFVSSSLFPLRVMAQGPADLGLPKPGVMLEPSSNYIPMMIKALRVHPENPTLFDFIVDSGQSGINSDNAQLRSESQKLIKYFLASLAIPEKELWVNLSPYEKNRIIPDALGQTEMGRDMLAQDYILKQLTASMIYPEKEIGRAFWNKIYAKSQELYGSVEIPVNTFNKVWIVADKAKVFVHDNTAFVVNSHLKVMLEQDYVALQHSRSGEPIRLASLAQGSGSVEPEDYVTPSHQRERAESRAATRDVDLLSHQKDSAKSLATARGVALFKERDSAKSRATTRDLAISKNGGVAEGGASPSRAVYEHDGETRGQDPEIKQVGGNPKSQEKTSSLGSQIIRELVLPALEKEVNQGRHFANLRQIFHSMILAAWYKKNLKDALLNQVYSNKSKIHGVDLSDKTIKEQIYQEYIKAYKKGVFNYIKEDIKAQGQNIPRKYFSGGIQALKDVSMTTNPADPDAAQMVQHPNDGAMFAVTAQTKPEERRNGQKYPYLSNVEMYKPNIQIGEKAKILALNYSSSFTRVEVGNPIELILSREKFDNLRFDKLYLGKLATNSPVLVRKEAQVRVWGSFVIISESKSLKILVADTDGRLWEAKSDLVQRALDHLSDEMSWRANGKLEGEFSDWKLTEDGVLSFTLNGQRRIVSLAEALKKLNPKRISLPSYRYHIPTTVQVGVTPKGTRVEVYSDANEAAVATALEQIRILEERNAQGLWTAAIIPTGETAIAVHKAFTQIVEERGIDCSRIIFIGMDEYLGAKIYEEYRQRHIFSKLKEHGFTMDNVVAFNGQAEDPRVELARFLKAYEKAKQKAGGKIQFMFGGIGTKGHLAFVEAIKKIANLQDLNDPDLWLHNEIYIQQGFNGDLVDFITRFMKKRDEGRQNIFPDKVRNKLRELNMVINEDHISQLTEKVRKQKFTIYVPVEIQGQIPTMIERISQNQEGSSYGEIEILPESRINDKVKLVELSPSTLFSYNLKDSGDDISRMPTQALTMGLNDPDIERVIVAANGNAKAPAVSKALEGEATIENPASMVQGGKVEYILDKNAAANLKGERKERSFQGLSQEKQLDAFKKRLLTLQQEIVSNLSNLFPGSLTIPPGVTGNALDRVFLEAAKLVGGGNRDLEDKFQQLKNLHIAVSQQLEDITRSIDSIHQLGQISAKGRSIDQIYSNLRELEVNTQLAVAESTWGGGLWKREELLQLLKQNFDPKQAMQAGPIFVPRALVPQEARMGLTPVGIKLLRALGVSNPIFVEAGSGVNRVSSKVYFTDEQYRKAGAVVLSHDEFVAQANNPDRKVVVSIKEPQRGEFPLLKNALLFTYLHLASNPDLAKELQELVSAAVGYETISYGEHGVTKTPVLQPASEAAGTLSAIRYAASIVGGTDDQKSQEAFDNPKSIPANTLNGKTVMVLGGGIAGQAAALTAAGFGARVFITEVNANRIAELNGIIRQMHLENKITVLQRNTDQKIGAQFPNELNQSNAIIGAVLVPGAKAPVEIEQETYENLVINGNLRFIADIAIDQGGNIAGSIERKYQDGWPKDGHGVGQFTVTNMPSALPLEVSFGLERAKIAYLVALLMGPAVAVKIFPELERGFNIIQGAITNDRVAQAMPGQAKTRPLNVMFEIDGIMSDFAKIKAFSRLVTAQRQEAGALGDALRQQINALIARIEQLPGYSNEANEGRLTSALRRTPAKLIILSSDWVKKLLISIVDNSMQVEVGQNRSDLRNPGGIDLDSTKMALEQQGQKINMRFDSAMMAQFRAGDFSGLSPFIVSVKAISNIRPLLGVSVAGPK